MELKKAWEHGLRLADAAAALRAAAQAIRAETAALAGEIEALKDELLQALARREPREPSGPGRPA